MPGMLGSKVSTPLHGCDVVRRGRMIHPEVLANPFRSPHTLA